MSTPEDVVERFRTDPDRFAALLDDPLRVIDEEGIPLSEVGSLVDLVRDETGLVPPDQRRRRLAALFRLLAAADRVEATARRQRTLDGLGDPPPAA